MTSLLNEIEGISSVTVWDGMSSFFKFAEDAAEGIVLIRIDNPLVPGLALTKTAAEQYPGLRKVWMAADERYALEAFPNDVDAYLLVPVTKEKLLEIFG